MQNIKYIHVYLTSITVKKQVHVTTCLKLYQLLLTLKAKSRICSNKLQHEKNWLGVINSHYLIWPLSLNEPSKICGRSHSKIFIIFYFTEKISLDISCQLFAKQTIHIKCGLIFSEKLKENVICCSCGFVCVEVLRPSQPNGGHVERGQFT